MKKITLHGPAVRNNGAFADAGAVISVGNEPIEITAARAHALCERKIAVVAPAPKSPAHTATGA